MINRSKIIAVAVICLFPFSLMAVVPQEQQKIEEYATFKVASWSYPDQHGQGIYGFFVGDNSTGSFQWNSGRWSGPLITNNNACEFECESGVYLGLDFRVLLNYTFLGLSHPSDFDTGINYFRLSISVINSNEVIFSQTNFTYDDLGGLYASGIWWYSEFIYLDSFLIMPSQTYLMYVNYSIFYGGA